MVTRGSVAVVLICIPVFFSLQSQFSDLVTQSLFENVDVSVKSTPCFKYINLEDILEDDVYLEKEFRSLSQDDKDLLSDLADLINETFSRSVLEGIQDGTPSESPDLLI